MVMLLLAVVSVMTGSMDVSEDEMAWRVFDGDNTQYYEAWRNANWQAMGRPDGFYRRRRLEEDGPPAAQEEGGFVDSKFSGDWWSLSFLYKSDVGASETVFTPERIQEMCRLEALVVSGLPSTWAVRDSAAELFYGGEAEGCQLLNQSTVDAQILVMYLDMAAQHEASEFARFVHPSFVTSNVSAFTRTVMEVYGGPGRSAEDHKMDLTQEVLLRDLGLEYSFLSSGLTVDEDCFRQSGPLRVRLSYDADEMDFMIVDDFVLAFCAIVIVFVLVYLYLNSAFLAAVTMYQIILSMPISTLLYRQVFLIDYFSFIHVLTVYLVLGIGADDVFVLVDGFRHFAEEKPIAAGCCYGDEELVSIFKSTIARSGQAIFNTSFTTAAAFLSQSTSKIMPMRTGGYYAAVCIIMNFIFTMLFTPSALVVYHRRLEGKRCCCPSPAARPEDAGVGAPGDQPAAAGGAQPLAKVSRCSANACFDAFLGKFYIPMMRKQVGGVRIFALGIAAIVLAMAAHGVYFTLQLTPPTEPEQWFPKSHMHFDVAKFWSNTFYEADYAKNGVISFVWGIKGADFTDFNVYWPSRTPPTAQFDLAFDVTTAEAHAEILAVCAEMQTLKCQLEGCAGYGDTLMISSSQKAYSCFLEDLMDWRANRTGVSQPLPTGDAFIQELRDFVAEDPSELYSSPVCEADYSTDIGFIDGELRYVSVKIRGRTAEDMPYSAGIKVHDLIQEFVDRRKAGAPVGLKSMFMVCDGLFSFYDLSEGLLNGFMSGISIAFPLSFLVLLLSTWNFLIALYAVICVGGIVVSVLGFCKSIMGWDLGIGEAIAGVIVIGYAVDYVVHLAHIYCEARAYGHETRDARANFAVKNMGSTIFAGAVTTAGAGAVMFFCYFTFFVKMATLICLTIMFSFVYSMGLFVAVLWLAGPEGTRGDLRCSRTADAAPGPVEGKVLGNGDLAPEANEVTATAPAPAAAPARTVESL